MAKRFTQTGLFKVLLFLFIWLMTGFTLGTGVLLGPVRWLAELGRNQGWSAGTEDVLVKITIAAFIIISFIIALWLSRGVNRSRKLHAKIGIPLLATAFAFASLFLWLSPRLASAGVGIEESANVQFTFGPYPEQADLEELKSEGYTAVISLLHPAVVPFEPVLQQEEEEAARKVGIEVIHLPMLPWVSENTQVLDSIRTLAQNPDARYYVHCYLGKDRVNVVKRVVEETGTGVAVTTQARPRSLGEIPFLERGEVLLLDEGVYLTPYPTDEEWFTYVLAGQIEHVVSLLDPLNPSDTPWISKEAELAAKYGLGFSLEPISATAFDPQAVLATAQKIRQLPRPLLLHGFLSPSYRTQALTQAYRSGRPPLAPDLFKAPLSRGEADVAAPNIALGPRPQGFEFGAYLYPRGVRSFIYVGEPTSAAARADQAVASQAGLSWQSVLPADTGYLYETLSEGGPYYLYGPGLISIRDKIKSRFGPAIPARIAPHLRRPPEPEPTAEEPPAKEPEEKQETPTQKGVIGFIASFLERALPSLKLVILLSPLLLLYAAFSGWLAGWLRVKKDVRAPYTRKVFHFLIFTMAAVLQIAIGLPAVILFGIIVSLAVVYATLRGRGFAFYEAMARPTDEPHPTLFIIIPLLCTAAGGVIANLFFTQFAPVGYLVAGWGDAVGEPVGARWGKHRYKVFSLRGVKATRSIEGSAAILVVGTVVAFLALLLIGVSPLTALWVSALLGLAGTVVEAFSNHGLDNLTIQVAVSALAWLLLR